MSHQLGHLRTGNRSIRFQAADTYFHTSESTDNIYLETDFVGYYTPTDSGSKYLSAQGYGFAIEVNHNFIILVKTHHN